VVTGIVSLHDFRPRPMNKPRAKYTFSRCGYEKHAGDRLTWRPFTNLNPLFTAGYRGKGQTIVVIEDTNVYSTADWTTFPRHSAEHL